MVRNWLIALKAIINLCGYENCERNKYDRAYEVRRLVPAIQKLIKKFWIFLNNSSNHEISVK